MKVQTGTVTRTLQVRESMWALGRAVPNGVGWDTDGGKRGRRCVAWALPMRAREAQLLPALEPTTASSTRVSSPRGHACCVGEKRGKARVCSAKTGVVGVGQGVGSASTDVHTQKHKVLSTVGGCASDYVDSFGQRSGE